MNDEKIELIEYLRFGQEHACFRHKSVSLSVSLVIAAFDQTKTMAK